MPPDIMEKITSTLQLIQSKLEEIKPKAIQLVRIVFDPDSFAYTETQRGTSTDTKKPDKATLTFENPRDLDSSIKEISFVPDATFQTKGMIEIHANEVLLYKNKTVADFTDIKENEIKYPNGKLLKRYKKVQVYIWNGTDATQVALTVQVEFGEVRD